MGLKSRTKGKAFERKIARALRAKWPDAIVRRSSQAERAYQSDVFVADAECPLLAKLWLELHDARSPNVKEKLKQAERDVESAAKFNTDIVGRIPVVIWHRLGERSIQASMRLGCVAHLTHGDERISPEIMTMDLGSFVRLVDGAVARGS